MTKLSLTLVLLGAFLQATLAKDAAPCKTRLQIPVVTNKQMEWLTQTGSKKYSVCPAGPGDSADYVILFTSEARQLTYSAPAGSATTTGDINMTTTVYTQQNWPYAVIYTYVYEGERDNPTIKGEGWHPQQPPIFVRSRSGAWHFNADRMALEDAVKFIHGIGYSRLHSTVESARPVSTPAIRQADVSNQPMPNPAIEPAHPQAIMTASGNMGTVSVTCDPDGAEIFIDSVGHGTAPAILKLTPGKHSVQLVRHGYKDWTSDLVVKENSVVNVTAKLQPRLP